MHQDNNRVPRLSAAIVIALLLASCGSTAPVHAADATAPALAYPEGVAADRVKRGEYLTHAADCQPCHTVPGGTPFAGGRAFKIPGGTLYTPNITPDKRTGIGNWTDDQFVNALQQGVDEHGRHMYPAFPYTSYTGLSRDDILAIKAYLFSLEPVEKRRTPSDISFPFNQRWAIGAWKALFFDSKRFQADSSKSDDWNRGAYLAGPLGHCGECHTPRNFAMATKSSKPLAGGEAEGWVAYNITPDKNSGIGGWSDDELAQYLSTGFAPGKGWANGPMGETISASLHHLSDGDRKAIVTWLRSVPPASGSEKKPRYAWSGDDRNKVGLETDTATAQGARLYSFYCAACHGSGDDASSPIYSSMANQSSVGANPPHNVMMVVLQGTRRPDNARIFMPAFRDNFTDDQVVALTNYISKRFGDPSAKISASDVKDARKQLQ
ncbi:MAG TPA: cytochrome c [Alphaproteobacteria bacterium]|nr:cytochrome c [Alphaproteobacteria bacterium]